MKTLRNAIGAVAAMIVTLLVGLSEAVPALRLPAVVKRIIHERSKKPRATIVQGAGTGFALALLVLTLLLVGHLLAIPGALIAFPALAAPKALKDLRKRHAEAVEAQAARLDAIEAEGGDPNEDEEYQELKTASAHLAAQVTEREALEEELGRLNQPAAEPEGPVPEQRGTDVRVTEDPADRPFTSLGEQLLAVRVAGSPGGRVDARLLRIREEQRAATGLSEGVPSDGGFLVQHDFVAGIIERTYNIGQILSRVDQLPLGDGRNGVKLNAEDETSRADGSRAGGVQAYWVAEAGQKSDSRPKFRQMELTLQKLAALVYATDELLEDAVALEGYISRKLPEELRFKAEDAVINGDGTGKPLGILNSGALVTVTPTGGAGTFTATDAAAVYARFWARSRLSPGAAWLYDQSVEPQLPQLHFVIQNAAASDNVGGFPANGIYMPAGANGNQFAKLFGIDMIPVEYMAQLGTVGDVLLADLMEYLFIARQIQSASSIHVRFIYDETTFRFVWRVDGQPAWNSPLTPKSGGDTLSPFVVLDTRS